MTDYEQILQAIASDLGLNVQNFIVIGVFGILIFQILRQFDFVTKELIFNFILITLFGSLITLNSYEDGQIIDPILFILQWFILTAFGFMAGEWASSKFVSDWIDKVYRGKSNGDKSD